MREDTGGTTTPTDRRRGRGVGGRSRPGAARPALVALAPAVHRRWRLGTGDGAVPRRPLGPRPRCWTAGGPVVGPACLGRRLRRHARYASRSGGVAALLRRAAGAADARGPARGGAEERHRPRRRRRPCRLAAALVATPGAGAARAVGPGASLSARALLARVPGRGARRCRALGAVLGGHGLPPRAHGGAALGASGGDAGSALRRRAPGDERPRGDS